MLGDALAFPTRSSDWIPTVIAGGVLTVLGFLVLPAIILQGYFVRILRVAAQDATEEGHAVPSFTDWSGLFVDGLKLQVINVVYSLAVVVPAGVMLLVLGASLSVGGRGSNLAAGVAGVGFLGVVVVLSLVVGYVVPAAYANFAIEGSLAAAFDFGAIREGAFTSEYAIAWLLGVVVGAVGGLVGSVFAILVVGIFVLFYVQVVTHYLFGRGFAAGRASRGVGSP